MGAQQPDEGGALVGDQALIGAALHVLHVHAACGLRRQARFRGLGCRCAARHWLALELCCALAMGVQQQQQQQQRAHRACTQGGVQQSAGTPERRSWREGEAVGTPRWPGVAARGCTASQLRH